LEISFTAEDLERIRRSVVMLSPRHPGGLDRECAIEVLEEIQRLQTRDRRVRQLLDQVTALLDGNDGTDNPPSPGHGRGDGR
jgi:hypothetical protein